MESKEKFKQRMINENRWQDFIAYRENLKAEGISAKEAWAKAREVFNRPGCSNRNVGRDDTGNDVISDGLTVRLDTFRDRPNASARQIVQWIFDNIDVEDARPQDAPSAGAWSFLIRVRKHAGLLQEFYRSIWSRMLPSKAEIEAREKFEDDGREQLHLIEQIKLARDKANE